MSYSNYVNSFYSNDVNVLKKRKQQAKVASICTATAGTGLAALSLLPKNKIKLPCVIGATLFLLGALNMHNYVKNTDKKIDSINING